MRVTVLGIGMGNPDTLTLGALRALERAGLILGARRLLDCLPASCRGERLFAVRPVEIRALVDANRHLEEIAVVMSGDTGFYSGAERLLPLLAGCETEVLCGVTTVQYLAARLRRPWQQVRLVSAHGTDCDIVGAVLSARETFFLTGGKITPAVIVRALDAAGLDGAEVTVGSQLSYPDERVVTDSVQALLGRAFPPLSAVWVRRTDAPVSPLLSSGLPDEAFVRGDVPMTKQEVRAAVLAKLQVCAGDVVYDIGAGTGSVSVELALLSPSVQVFAVERGEAACSLIEENRRKFGALRVTPVRGLAPEALAPLPPPDRAFVGGSGGNMRGILAALLAKNPRVRVVISAIAAETLGEALSCLKELSFSSIEISQLSVSRSRPAGGLHLLMGQNPVFLLSAEGGAL